MEFLREYCMEHGERRTFLRGETLEDGYEDGWAKVNIPEGYKDNTLKVPMINMRKSIIKTIGLDEVVVKATRIKLSLSRVKPITFMAVSGKR